MEFKVANYKILDITSNILSEIPYGVQMIGSPLEWSETKGKGIKIAVLDTGCPQHRDILVKGSYNAMGSGEVYDKHGHSTHCCGIIGANGAIKGVAPEVELYAVKVLGDDGSGSAITIADGINWCIANNIDVISMSLGSSYDAPIERQAIQNAYNAGIIIVAAAGNEFQDENTNTISYPAKYNEVLAVSAIDKNMEHGYFSSSGAEVDVATAGVEVYSTYLNNQYALLSGTSMACPHMAGAIALLQAKAKIRYGRKLTPQEVFTLVQMYAEDIGNFGKDNLFGYGVFTFGRFDVSEYIESKIELGIGSNKMYVNGVEKTIDVPAQLINGRTMIPLRAIAEALNCSVSFDSVLKKITITK